MSQRGKNMKRVMDKFQRVWTSHYNMSFPQLVLFVMEFGTQNNIVDGEVSSTDEDFEKILDCILKARNSMN